MYWSCSRAITLLATFFALSGCGLTVTSRKGPFGVEVAMVLIVVNLAACLTIRVVDNILHICEVLNRQVAKKK